jgi:O-antigen/teichoic acid export membrane protein
VSIGESAPEQSMRLELRSRAFAGALWTLASFAGQNALRLASNLLLTRLLFPEAFGLMALVTVVIEGLALFSDVGLRQSVVAHARGEDPRFLHTVWSIQVARGALIFAIAVALAWPVARFYGQPQLAGLIACTALSALVAGLTSVNVALQGRRLSLGRLNALDLGTQAIVAVVTIALAWVYSTVWVLPLAAILSRGIWCAVSHVWLPGPRMRLAWDASMRAEVLQFGRWILVSSIFGYFINNLDRLALGMSMSMAELGAYSVAALLARVVLQVERRLNDEVLFPVLSRMGETRSPHNRAELVRARLALILLTHPPLIVMAVLGPELIGLLYDERYAQAGWILQVLAVGLLFKTAVEPAEQTLLAQRDSFRFMQMLVMRSTIISLAVLLAGWQLGPVGIVVAVAAGDVLAYPALAWGVRRYGAWLPALELGSFALSAGIVAVALLAKG